MEDIKEHYNTPYYLVGDYIFSYAYPISFVGALFYSIASIVNVDPSAIVANKNVTVMLNMLVGTCGVISLFAFFKVNGNIPIVGSILLPNGNETIKTNVTSGSTY
jgi:hypothetical protein